MLPLELCTEDISLELIFSCPADHVPDWQLRILLGMVEARSVDVKNTTTTRFFFKQLLTQCCYHRGTRLNAMKRFVFAAYDTT